MSEGSNAFEECTVEAFSDAVELRRIVHGQSSCCPGRGEVVVESGAECYDQGPGLLWPAYSPVMTTVLRRRYHILVMDSSISQR